MLILTKKHFVVAHGSFENQAIWAYSRVPLSEILFVESGLVPADTPSRSSSFKRLFSSASKKTHMVVRIHLKMPEVGIILSDQAREPPKEWYTDTTVGRIPCLAARSC